MSRAQAQSSSEGFRRYLVSLAHATSKGELWRSTAAFVRELVPAERVSLMRQDAVDPHHFHPVAIEGLLLTESPGPVPLENTVAEAVLRSGELRYDPDLEAAPPFADLLKCREAKLRSAVTLPLFSAHGPLGVLSVVRRTLEAFSGRELSLLAQIGAALASHLSTLEQRQHADEALRRAQTILDHADGGFALITTHGRVTRASKGLVAWIGEEAEGRSLWAWLGQQNPGFGERLEVSWSALIDAFMPTRVALRRMPERLRLGALHLQLEFHPVFEETELLEVVMVARDVTSRLEEERERELTSAMRHYAQHPGSFAAFLRESETVVARMRRGEVSAPEVHTLKGNALVVGARALTRALHDIESAWDEPDLRTAAIEHAAKIWTAYRDKLKFAAGIEGHEEVALSRKELERFEARLRDQAPALLEEVAHWRFERVGARLEKLADSACSVARQLGKPEPDIELRGGDLRLDPARFGPLWMALVHPIHNAVDHGLESPEARLAAGKLRHGHILLAIEGIRDGSWLEVRVRDDGAGVDWEAVRAAARGLDLNVDATRDLERAFFTHPLTTKATHTMVSGGGMGLSAIAEVAEALGGDVELESRRGEGTEVRIRVPMLASGTHRSASGGDPEPAPTSDPTTVQAMARHSEAVRRRVDRIRAKAEDDASTLLKHYEANLGAPIRSTDPALSRDLMRLLQRQDVRSQELANLSHSIAQLLDTVEGSADADSQRMPELLERVEALLPRSDLDPEDPPEELSPGHIELFP